MLGTAFYNLGKYAYVLIAARLGRPEDVGGLALGFAVVTPFIGFLNLQLRTVLSTDASRRFRFATYLKLKVCTSAVALAILGLAPLMFGDWGWIVLTAGGLKISDTIAELYFGKRQQERRMKPIAVSSLLRGTLTAIAFYCGFVATGSVAAALAAAAAASATVLVLYDVRAGRSEESRLPCAADEGMSAMLSFAWPMGVATMLMHLGPAIPSYAVALFRGQHELGIYSALSSVVMAGQLAAVALTQAAAPHLSRAWREGPKSSFLVLLRKLLGIVVVFALLVLTAVMMGGRWLVGLLFGAEYSYHVGLLVALCVVAPVLYCWAPLGHALTAAGMVRPQPLLLLVGCGLALVVSLATVPTLGATGAAVALGASGMVQCAGALWLLRRGMV
jgi:O-antigen/teichoic acid export membrane protein